MSTLEDLVKEVQAQLPAGAVQLPAPVLPPSKPVNTAIVAVGGLVVTSVVLQDNPMPYIKGIALGILCFLGFQAWSRQADE